MPLVRHSCLREAWLSMAQVSDTKDIGGDTWKEAGVGEFARTFGGNCGGNWGEVGWKLKGKWEGIGEKVRRNLRGSIGGNGGEIGANCQGNRKTQCFFSMVSAKENTEHRVSQSFLQKAAQNLRRRREDSSLGPPFLQTRSPKTTFSGTSSNCRAVRGGGGRGGGGWRPKNHAYLTCPGGGRRGGVILHPLSGIQSSSLRYPTYATRRTMSADICFSGGLSKWKW